jgi:hypothetical protein
MRGFVVGIRILDWIYGRELVEEALVRGTDVWDQGIRVGRCPACPEKNGPVTLRVWALLGPVINCGVHTATYIYLEKKRSRIIKRFLNKPVIIRNK